MVVVVISVLYTHILKLASPLRNVVVFCWYLNAENRVICPSARRQRRLPSPPRNLKNICICRLLYKYSTHTVLYCILRFACPAARRQRRLPSPPRTVVVLIAAAYQRTFNNRELFLLLFTTNLFGLAIQRRVSSKEVVPTKKTKEKQGTRKNKRNNFGTDCRPRMAPASWQPKGGLTLL